MGPLGFTAGRRGLIYRGTAGLSGIHPRSQISIMSAAMRRYSTPPPLPLPHFLCLSLSFSLPSFPLASSLRPPVALLSTSPLTHLATFLLLFLFASAAFYPFLLFRSTLLVVPSSSSSCFSPSSTFASSTSPSISSSSFARLSSRAPSSSPSRRTRSATPR